MGSPKKKGTGLRKESGPKLPTPATASSSTPAPLKVFLKPRAASWLASLTSMAEREAVKNALREIPQAFGKPHLHTGLGLRRLRPGLWECRVGLVWRPVFVREADALVVVMIGTHDEVRTYLKENS